MEIIAIVILISIGLFIEIHIYKNAILPHIAYECHFSKDEVFEGEEIEIIETVMNPSNFLVPCVKSEITTSKHLEFAKKSSAINDRNRSLASLFAVHGKQKITRTWKVTCTRRGIFPIEDTSIVGTDLFGLEHYSQVIRVKDKLIVLPQPIDIENDLQLANEEQGDYVVKRFILEDPFEIAGVREYTSRDGMNKVQWKLTASQGRLMVRNNEATAKKSITILLNLQSYIGQLKEAIHDPKIEWAIKITAGELEKARVDSVPVRLLTNGYIDEQEHELVSGDMWGNNHVHDLLVLLASLGETYSVSFDKFLKQYETSIHTTEVILLSCYIDEVMLHFIREKQLEGIWVKVYLLTYETDSKHYEGITVYYLMDYLEEMGKAHEGKK